MTILLSKQVEEEIKEEAKKVKESQEYGTLTPPSLIISSASYPKTNAYILFPLANNQETLKKMEKYQDLAAQGYYEAINIRMRTLGMKREINIKSPEKVEDMRLLGMGERKTEIESKVEKVYYSPKLKHSYQSYAPFIPLIKIRNIEYGNIKINKHVEKVYYDVDWKANEGIKYLYSHGIDEYKLSRYFSLGVMGTKLERKLVPTKWSITAIDDIIYKHIHHQITNKDTINNIKYYYSEIFYNKYHIFLIPGSWQYELIELCYGKNKINQDYENWWGRKDYANNTAGAYYAIRKILIEHLKDINKQAKVLVIREVGKNYKSLGVWVVREGVRKAISSPLKNISEKEMNRIIREINKRAHILIPTKTEIQKISKVLRHKAQKKLFQE